MSEINTKIATLGETVESAVKNYLKQESVKNIRDLYEVVMAEVERPLFKCAMEQTRGNQSEAALILGVSRGTLRKKLKMHDLI